MSNREFQDNLEKKVIECYTCRDKGGEGEPCEECGKVLAVSGSTVKEELLDIDYDKMSIPPNYVGKVFNGGTLIGMKPGKENDHKFITYAKTLDKIHDHFLNGRLPKSSAIIISPRGFGKRTFAYSCMQLATRAGLTTFPIMDTGSLKRFLIMQEERPFSKWVGNWTYEEFLEADVLFITVTKMYTKATAYQVIDQVTDMRSRLGKSTIILSESSWKEITAFDNYNTFDSILWDDDTKDPYKYLSMVQYYDSTSKENAY